MKIKVDRVSRKKDGKTWCRPSEGYKNDSVEIDLSEYHEISTISGPLPVNDAVWPKGAPFADVVRNDCSILERMQPLGSGTA